MLALFTSAVSHVMWRRRTVYGDSVSFLYIDGSNVCNMHDASAAENDAARVVQKLLKLRKIDSKIASSW